MDFSSAGKAGLRGGGIRKGMDSSESELSEINSDDSPPARRHNLAQGPTDHQQLATWRARKRRVEKRLWYLAKAPDAARTDWELRYLQLMDADLSKSIERGARILGHKERERKTA
jgi:hypothetical protein